MLDLEGQQYDVLIKEIDFDTLKGQAIEMDFQALVKGEKSSLCCRGRTCKP